MELVVVVYELSRIRRRRLSHGMTKYHICVLSYDRSIINNLKKNFAVVAVVSKYDDTGSTSSDMFLYAARRTVMMKQFWC